MSRPCPLLPIACAFVLSIASPAGAAPQEWGVQLGTEFNDRTPDLAHDGAGGAFLVSSHYEVLATTLEYQAVVQHILPGGQIHWTHDLGAFGDEDRGHAVALDGAGGAVFAGTTSGDIGSPSNGELDAFVVNYDGQGQLLWARQYGGPGFEEALAICADGAGGWFLAGKALGGFGGGPAGATVAWVMRLDGSGQSLWTKTFSGSVGIGGVTEPAAIASDGAGGLYVGGTTSGNLSGTSAGHTDGWLARMNAAGGVLWLRQFGSAAFDRIHALEPADDLGVFVGGGQGGLSAGGYERYLGRFSSSGDLLWSVVGSQPGDDEIEGLTLDGAGGVFACGYAVAPVVGSTDAFFARYSGGGTLQLMHHFGHPFGAELATAIDSDGGSGLLLAGEAWVELYPPFIGGAVDLFLAHFDACELDPWTSTCTSMPNSTGKSALIGAYGSVRVSNNAFKLVSSSCPTGMLGLYLMSTTVGSTPFGNGVLCVGGNVLRLLPVLSTGLGAQAVLALDFTDPNSNASQITPGSSWNFQFWFRDVAAGGAGFNLSNGLSVTFCP